MVPPRVEGIVRPPNPQTESSALGARASGLMGSALGTLGVQFPGVAAGRLCWGRLGRHCQSHPVPAVSVGLPVAGFGCAGYRMRWCCRTCLFVHDPAELNAEIAGAPSAFLERRAMAVRFLDAWLTCAASDARVWPMLASPAHGLAVYAVKPGAVGTSRRAVTIPMPAFGLCVWWSSSVIAARSAISLAVCSQRAGMHEAFGH